MAEISIEFKNKLNGYDKDEVNQFVRDAEEMLQEKALELARLQQQVVDLEARLEKITGADSSVEEKVELYDKLMKKMDGDYANLLSPAIAKAKSIEEQAKREYDVRIDQARHSADGIYSEAADRIAGVVDSNMDRMYGLMERFMYSKTLPGRVDSFFDACKILSTRIGSGAKKIVKAPRRAVRRAKRKARINKLAKQNKACVCVEAEENA